tara:strand:+ start:62 stop:211 length:150 start_codon:yes stop_codon:yes gene_type:complete
MRNAVWYYIYCIAIVGTYVAVHGEIAWPDKKSQKKPLDIANMYGKMEIK